METFEPPKYLEKLIAAINEGAKSAQLGALAFTAIGVFLLATAFSATDEGLLLNRALTISQCRPRCETRRHSSRCVLAHEKHRTSLLSRACSLKINPAAS